MTSCALDGVKAVLYNKNCLFTKEQEVHKVLNEVFSRFRPSEVFLSFNGGKDCTVLLDLVSNYFKKQNKTNPCVIPLIYIQPLNPFQEVEYFVSECVKVYNVDITKKQGNLKNILQEICNERPQLKAVIMGCRRTDPHCAELQIMQKTDSDWPPLLRINPILDWTCKDIWEYIREKHILYCSLYDDGYSSLGDKTNTRKNPHLLYVNSKTGISYYGQASDLVDEKLERAGRF